MYLQNRICTTFLGKTSWYTLSLLESTGCAKSINLWETINLLKNLSSMVLFWPDSKYLAAAGIPYVVWASSNFNYWNVYTPRTFVS